MGKLNILDTVTTAGRLAVLGAAIAVAGASVTAAPLQEAQEQTEVTAAAPAVPHVGDRSGRGEGTPGD